MHTSWDKSGDWYGKLVGESGHYFHQHVILPKSLQLLSLKPHAKILDIGCGNGWFSHHLPPNSSYLGVDSAPSLISQARQNNQNSLVKFETLDFTKSLKLHTSNFSHAVAILSLQNMEHPEQAFLNASNHMVSNGKLLVILNHPVFRIPRQTEWGIDPNSKIQYRRINRYLSPLKIPISTHPGQNNSPLTWSFHHSIQDYSRYLFSSGFAIEKIEEWISDKHSQGSAAKMENFARQEFPLFMAILAVKK